ncbi:type 1 glutamine amidotransferase [Pedobacter africanus]|uniref:Type 1 glutamine amidotransferase n=1 Tax=Pedobacter africanus TaxID=151894 RepID=A0ACC6KZB7_9SPHI|nr:ThuA domain-containing protein [Pedobacter africanus]MDR6784428.1 type 1 glutamine amidotransferase [Pedobacter africanus]
MSNTFARCLTVAFLILIFTLPATAKKKRILVFSKTAGFYHQSIPAGIAAIQQLGRENDFEVDTTKNAALFTLKNLKKYAAVVFLSTTGDVFDEGQQAAFEQYIKAGGGYAGIHAATDTEYGWPWYGKLAGAWFISHPAQQVATLNVINTKTIATRHLPEAWKRKDEWYNFKAINPDLKVLIKIDESSYKGGANGDNHPMSWYHDFDGGRSFYTALGHVEESYTDPLFLKHILGGIQYAMGVKKMETVL